MLIAPISRVNRRDTSCALLALDHHNDVPTAKASEPFAPFYRQNDKTPHPRS